MSKALNWNISRLVMICVPFMLSGESVRGAEESVPTRQARTSAAEGADRSEANVPMPMPVGAEDRSPAWYNRAL